MNWIILGLGGALGAISRHFMGAGVLHLTGWKGHWGTTVVNISGCFLMGLFSTLVGLRFGWGLHLRYFFFTGFLGAYTTFSTYMLENFLLIEEGHPYLGALNALGSVALGFLALWGGIVLARTLV